jgi:hypothetical protein
MPKRAAAAAEAPALAKRRSKPPQRYHEIAAAPPPAAAAEGDTSESDEPEGLARFTPAALDQPAKAVQQSLKTKGDAQRRGTVSHSLLLACGRPLPPPPPRARNLTAMCAPCVLSRERRLLE